MIKCLTYGLGCSKEQFHSYIQTHQNPYSVAHYSFEMSLLEELNRNSNMEIRHNYIFQESNRRLRRALIKSKEERICDTISSNRIGFINLPVIKFFSMFFVVFYRTFVFCRKRKSDDHLITLSTINYFPVAAANLLVSHFFPVKNILIVTDCSDSYAYNGKNVIRRLYKKAVRFLEIRYDGYVFFSGPMNHYINKNNKPFCIMEGIFNKNDLDFGHVEKENAILYAGSLQPHLGVDHLIQAFLLLDNSEYELWIIGDGDYKKELENLSNHHPRVKFLGFMERKQVFEYEKKAKVLVNVRDPKLSYTKYSFPSKTFEYMASGTPVLMTKLECLPQEYYPHLFLIDDNNVSTIKEAMEMILSLDDETLTHKGRLASEFVKDKKNGKEQTKKVFDLIERLQEG